MFIISCMSVEAVQLQPIHTEVMISSNMTNTHSNLDRSLTCKKKNGIHYSLRVMVRGILTETCKKKKKKRKSEYLCLIYKLHQSITTVGTNVVLAGILGQSLLV